MFFQHIGKVLCCLLTEENLPFAVLDVLLKVQGNGLRKAEVFQVGRYIIAHFLTDTEEVVGRVPAGENYRSEVPEIDPLFFAYIASRHPFDMDKCPEVELKVIFLRKGIIRRFFVLWFR